MYVNIDAKTSFAKNSSQSTDNVSSQQKGVVAADCELLSRNGKFYPPKNGSF
jgi:hypothetical protein